MTERARLIGLITIGSLTLLTSTFVGFWLQYAKYDQPEGISVISMVVQLGGWVVGGVLIALGAIRIHRLSVATADTEMIPFDSTAPGLKISLHQARENRTVYRYSLLRNGEEIGSARVPRQILPRCRSITIAAQSGQPVVQLRQEELLSAILDRVLPLRFSAPYRVFVDEQEKGSLRREPSLNGWALTGRWNGRSVVVILHSGPLYSIWLDGEQVGLAAKNPVRINLADRYEALCNSDLDPFLLAALLTLIDVSWHTEDAMFFTGSTVEAWHLLSERRRLDPDWRPSR